MWVYHYIPESRQQSKVWLKKAYTKPKKAKTVLSAGKLMATMLWNVTGILLVWYMPKGMTINADTYCDILHELRRVIWRKRPWLSDKNVFLVRGHALLHLARKTADLLGAAHTSETNCLKHVAWNMKYLYDATNGIYFNGPAHTMKQETYVSWNLLIVLREKMLRNFRGCYYVFHWFKWKEYNKLLEICFPNVHWVGNMLHAMYCMKHVSCNTFHRCAPCLTVLQLDSLQSPGPPYPRPCHQQLPSLPSSKNT